MMILLIINLVARLYAKKINKINTNDKLKSEIITTILNRKVKILSIPEQIYMQLTLLTLVIILVRCMRIKKNK